MHFSMNNKHLKMLVFAGRGLHWFSTLNINNLNSQQPTIFPESRFTMWTSHTNYIHCVALTILTSVDSNIQFGGWGWVSDRIALESLLRYTVEEEEEEYTG